MMHKSTERGQALILIALAAIGLFAFSALAIDGSRQFSNKRNAQNAADTAVLTAALTQVRTGSFTDAVTAAKARATSNGYTHDGVETWVLVNKCSDQDKDLYTNTPLFNGDGTAKLVDCQGLPTGADATMRAEYIRVRIVSTIPTTFGRVIGRQSMMSAAEAVAHVIGTTSSGTLFDGAGLATLKPDGADAFDLGGNATLQIVDSGAFVNSNGNCGMSANGNLTMTVSTSFAVAGTECENGNVHRNGPITQASQIPYPPNLNIPEPVINCGTDIGHNVGNTYYPGTWSGTLSFNGSGNVTMMPGNYCLQNGASFNGNTNITANGVNVRLTSGEFIINGNSTFTCSNATFFSDGGQGFRFNGNGVNNCTEVFFYARTGEVRWNGNVANTFQAKTGGTYKGLLIYMPYGNTTPLHINGNSGNHIKGTILAVQAPINLNGNMGTEVMDSQVIGYTVKFNGNGTLKIDYDGDENFSPPASPSIQLTK